MAGRCLVSPSTHSRPRRLPVAILAGVLVLCVLCNVGFYRWAASDCAERGGHIEVVWGGKGGWVCDGARSDGNGNVD